MRRRHYDLYYYRDLKKTIRIKHLVLLREFYKKQKSNAGK